MLVVRVRQVEAQGSLVRVAPRQAATTCAYCHDPLPAKRRDCGCGAAYHRDCWVELGRCATLGCRARPGKQDHAESGRCPFCDGDVRKAFPWELSRCAGCGARYHLGCRAMRARCHTPGCRSGAHDAWGVPAPPPLRERVEALVDRALLALLGRWSVLSVSAALCGVALAAGATFHDLLRSS